MLILLSSILRPDVLKLWSVFSCIRIKYVDLRSKSPYSVRMQENTDLKKLGIWTLFTQSLVRHTDIRMLTVGLTLIY